MKTVTYDSAVAAIEYVSSCNTASRESEAYDMLVEAATPLSAAEGGDWMTPTTYAQRLSDALTLLCGGRRPPEEAVTGWLCVDSDNHALQDFCADNGPAWAQGIVCIDAALLLAATPTEGVAHEMPRSKYGSPAQTIAALDDSLVAALAALTPAVVENKG